MTKKSPTIHCPLCDGTGRAPEPSRDVRQRREDKKEAARVLREAGYSLREIQRALDYKSVRSVYLAVRSDG